MPCIKCANGKWKYGVHGNCQFDTLGKCRDAEAAIHIQEEAKATPKPKQPSKPRKPGGAIPVQPEGPHVPAMPPGIVTQAAPKTAAPKPVPPKPLIVEQGTKPAKPKAPKSK